jgi:hypothetical protein
MAFFGDGRSTASKQGGDDGKRVLAGIVAALAEEAECDDIVSKDEALTRFSIFVTRESGVICAAGDPFWPQFCVAYPPASI